VRDAFYDSTYSLSGHSGTTSAYASSRHQRKGAYIRTDLRRTLTDLYANSFNNPSTTDDFVLGTADLFYRRSMFAVCSHLMIHPSLRECYYNTGGAYN
jgi:hypothetical protein